MLDRFKKKKRVSVDTL